MIHSEQVKIYFPQEAPPRTTDPTSGQGGVARGARDAAATCLPVAACGKRPREYFNKEKNAPFQPARSWSTAAAHARCPAHSLRSDLARNVTPGSGSQPRH